MNDRSKSDPITPNILLTRAQTALGTQIEGIRTEDRRVVAVQVQFNSHGSNERSYADERLENGDILLIGRGKRPQGDQRRSHGNGAILDSLDRGDGTAFPVYEKVAANQYVYLGDYSPLESTYSELELSNPGYQVYRFRLRLADEEATVPVDRDVIRRDFSADTADELPPERRAYVRSIIARNKTLAEAVKREANYRCERCGSITPWMTTAGKPYVEVHHIIPLGDDGFDNLANMIAVCSDCHKQLHYSTDRLALATQLRVSRDF
jgi:5-methylcytosine-specific restriction protein A